MERKRGGLGHDFQVVALLPHVKGSVHRKKNKTKHFTFAIKLVLVASLTIQHIFPEKVSLSG